MKPAPAVRIRAMAPEDIDFATGLAHAAGWSSESREVFASFLAHDAGGCFVAEAGGERAGVCVATMFRQSGFIGELIVSPHLRLLGAGPALFLHALDHLLARRPESIYLDGDLNAVPYYETRGFRKVCRSLRFRGKIAGGRHGHIRSLRPGDLERICELDAGLFGEDRGFFLRRRAERFPHLVRVAERRGEIRGWIMARPGDGLLAVGPWAALAPGEAAPLLEHLAGEQEGQAVRIGVLERNEEAVRLLRAWPGLSEGVHSWRMVHGAGGRLGDHPALYAIGSGAKG